MPAIPDFETQIIAILESRRDVWNIHTSFLCAHLSKSQKNVASRSLRAQSNLHAPPTPGYSNIFVGYKAGDKQTNLSINSLFGQKMKAILMSLALAASLVAGEVPEDVRTASPDGVFQARVVKVAETNTRRLEITQKDGKTLYISPPEIEGTDILDFYDKHLRWSPDSRILAISAGYQKMFLTYLFAWDGKKFNQIKMPPIAAEEDNKGIYPTQWTKGHTLRLKISGPHAGKASGGGYEGTAVIQVDLQAMTAKKLKEDLKRLHPKE